MRAGNGEIRPRHALRTSRLASSWSATAGRTALQSDLRSCRSSLRQRLAPGAGFEPATNRLTADCSTAELSGIARPIAYSKSGLLRRARQSTRGRTRRKPVRAERGAGMSSPLQGSVARPRAPLLDIARSRKRGAYGLVAEWLRRGLQILEPRFDSGRGLQTSSILVPASRRGRRAHEAARLPFAGPSTTTRRVGGADDAAPSRGYHARFRAGAADDGRFASAHLRRQRSRRARGF